MEGGTESALKKAEGVLEPFPDGPKLYRFFWLFDHNKQDQIQIQRVDVTADWITRNKYKNDAFILDSGVDIFVWHAKNAAFLLKHRVDEVANLINWNHRKGKAKVSEKKKKKKQG